MGMPTHSSAGRSQATKPSPDGNAFREDRCPVGCETLAARRERTNCVRRQGIRVGRPTANIWRSAGCTRAVRAADSALRGRGGRNPSSVCDSRRRGSAIELVEVWSKPPVGHSSGEEADVCQAGGVADGPAAGLGRVLKEKGWPHSTRGTCSGAMALLPRGLAVLGDEVGRDAAAIFDVIAVLACPVAGGDGVGSARLAATATRGTAGGAADLASVGDVRP